MSILRQAGKPDWWTDGFGASARETATTRLASSSLIANEAGLSTASIAGVKLPDEINKSIDLADNALLFYTEHTLGYSESVREPLSQPTMQQHALKESYAWEANFNADQRGGHSWTYYLTTSSDVSNGFATRFGWGCRIPFLSRVLPGSGTGDNNWKGSFITREIFYINNN
jgi:hypothetical protein